MDYISPNKGTLNHKNNQNQSDCISYDVIIFIMNWILGRGYEANCSVRKYRKV